MKTILKNKIFLILMLLVVMMSYTQIVNAFSTTMSLTTTSQIKPGGVVEVTLKITNIDAGDGIDAVVATVEYDKNIFDEITEDNIETLNKWKVGAYNEDSGEFTLLKSSKVNTPSDVLKISFRAKESANVDKATIKIKNISASGGAVEFGGTGDIQIQEVSVSIPKATGTEKPPVVNEITNEITNEVVEDPIVNQVINQVANEVTNTTKTNTMGGNLTNTNKTNTNNGGTTGRLPQTGENIATYIAGISIVTVIAIIAFVKYRNINL